MPMTPSPSPANFGQFADPRRFLRSQVSAFRPKPKIRVSEFALTRKLNNTGGGYVGKWNNAVAPYLVQIMDETQSRVYDTAAIVGPGQSGKTAAIENAVMLHKPVNVPSNVLWYMQNDDAIEAYVKSTINPMIEDHRDLSSRLGGRPVDDTLHFKRFRDMTMEFLAANRGNLINKKAPVLVFDELDAYDPSLGDPWEQGDIRRQTFGSASSMVIGISHPDRATGLDPDRDWLHGIMAWYRKSTQGRWYWPCPICGRVSSPNPGAKFFCELVFPKEPDVPLEEVARQAHLFCPHNGCKIPDASRGLMNRGGDWVHIGQDIEPNGKIEGEKTRDTRFIGWWIVGVMSPFIIGGIGELARKIVSAERAFELTGEEDTVREVYAKSLAIPRKFSTDKNAPIDTKLLKAREDHPLGYIPDGVLFLIVAVDTQGDRFVVQVEGYGENLERWVVDRFDILQPKLAHGVRQRKLAPATYPEDWDVLADELLDRAWAFGSDLETGLKPRLIVFDAFGQDGVTDNAKDFWTRLADRGYGDRMLPLKGEPGYRHPRVILSYLDAEKKDKYTSLRREIPYLRMKSDPLKDSVAAALRREHRGGRYINFPVGLPQSFYDEYTAEEKGPNGWVKVRTRNESLDLSAYSLGAAYHLDADKIDWKNSVPVWAQLRAGNPYYVSLKAAPAEPEPAPQQANHSVKLAMPRRKPQSMVDRIV